jgi:hypothetical protein
MRGPACLFYNAVRHQLNSRHLLKALLRKGIGYTGFHVLEIRGIQRLAVHEGRPADEDDVLQRQPDSTPDRRS